MAVIQFYNRQEQQVMAFYDRAMSQKSPEERRKWLDERYRYWYSITALVEGRPEMHILQYYQQKLRKK